ncbi:MAG: hypothetical protein AAFX87_00725 [Bacteroidota bacterium]
MKGKTQIILMLILMVVGFFLSQNVEEPKSKSSAQYERVDMQELRGPRLHNSTSLTLYDDGQFD